MSNILKDKVAIITGGGRGIGKAFAVRFAKEGAKLLLADIALESAESAAAEIKAKGGEAYAVKVDISNKESTEAMAKKAVELYGRVDILVNNASIWAGLEITPWDAWSEEEWDRIFDVNVKGTWLCCKAVAPLMVKQGKGKIINIASGVPKSPAAQLWLPYSVSKGGVYTLSHALARVLGPSGINVNTIAPGYTASEASLAQKAYREIEDATIAARCIPRSEKPEDLIGSAVFLASDDSDFLAGQILYVDGGATIA